MNGFMREDSLQTIGFADNLDNERYQSNSYETPSKIPRIETETNMSSNDLNSRKTNVVNTHSDNVPEVANNGTNNEVMPSSSSTATTHLIQSNAINNTIVTNNSFSSNMSESVANQSSKEKRKQRYRHFMKLKERFRYQQLLNRHKSQPPTVTDKPLPRKEESSQFIDLTSEKSFVSNPTISSVQTSQQPFKTEILDNNSKVNLINRIKSNSTVVPILTQPITTTVQSNDSILSNRRPLFSTVLNKNNPFSSHSTPKTNLCDTKSPQSLPKTPEPTEKSVGLTSLPESSKKFNDLMKTKNDYLGKDFVSDLRSGLLKSIESEERKISKSESFLTECQIKRVSDCESLSAKLKTPITQTELLPYIPFIGFDDKIEEEVEDEEEEEEDDTAPSDFPVLTPDMNREIDAALRPTPPDEVLSEGFTIQICRKDMETLKGLNWLNDEIINFYLSLIVERGKNDNFPTVYAFNTFFYKKLKDGGPDSLKRWTRKVNVFANDFIFIPIHLGMHWCLAVIDFINKKIEYYDSMGGTNTECVQSLKKWLQAESINKNCQFNINEWSLQMAKDIPQQMNGSDCGMFSCKYAEYISRKARINFSQAHMPYFRRRMVYEILTKQLL